jgi:nucleoside-diphosphate-sugar epimerase
MSQAASGSAAGGGNGRGVATVLGAEGFVGAALVARLRALGWKCWTPSRSDAWPNRSAPLGHIFFCAGLTADYLSRPGDTVEAHAGLLSRVLASEQWESLIYLSSTRLYDKQPSMRGTSEDGGFVLNPNSTRHLYDLSKLLGENLCTVMGQGRARVARLACVYRDHRDPGGFVGELLRRVNDTPAGGVLLLDSAASCERDYVHLDDVLTALIRIATEGQRGVYNVASGENVSNATLAQWILRFTGVRIEFTQADKPERTPTIDCSALHADCGWKPHRVSAFLKNWAQTRLSMTPRGAEQ